MPLPTVVAGTILVLALVAAFAFTAMRGGVDLAAAPALTASPAPTARAGSAGPSVGATAQPTAAATSSGSTATAAPSPASPGPATPAPTASPAPATPAPTASPAPATPAPTASPADPRYAGLRPCPDRPDCYLYVVRRGDTLSSIAAFFGVSLRAVRDLNEEIENPSVIHVDQKIRVPAPR